MILIHGFGSSSRAWKPQLLPLGETFRVVSVDLPGHGGQEGPFSLDASVARVREELTDGAHVVGISGGATIAMLVALAEPERLGSLVLSAPVAAPPAGLAVQRTIMRLLPEPALRRMVAKMYSGAQAEYVATALEDFSRCGKPTLMASLRYLAHLDIRDRLSSIDAATLVVYGGRDRANRAPSTAVADGIPKAELREIPDVGHMWNLEKPDLFTTTVTEFADAR